MIKTNIRHKLLLVLVFDAVNQASAKTNHDFLHNKYNAFHDSLMKQKFRQIAPMLFVMVVLPWFCRTEEDMRLHFRMMKGLVFNNLKQTMATPEWPEQETLRVALEERIIPFWYSEDGREAITPKLLQKLRLPNAIYIKEAREHSKILEYQNDFLFRHLEIWKKNPCKSWEYFVNDNLLKTIPGPKEIVPSAGWECGQAYDILGYKADINIFYLEATKIPSHPEQPARTGGEMVLLPPFASSGTDMEGIAELMRKSAVLSILQFIWPGILMQ